MIKKKLLRNCEVIDDIALPSRVVFFTGGLSKTVFLRWTLVVNFWSGCAGIWGGWGVGAGGGDGTGTDCG